VSFELLVMAVQVELAAAVQVELAAAVPVVDQAAVEQVVAAFSLDHKGL
jgi:hypothetical protein